MFFPTDIFAAAPPVKTAESSVLSPQTVKPGLPRLTDSFGAFFAFGGTVDEDYVETDEALQCASTMAPRAVRPDLYIRAIADVFSLYRSVAAQMCRSRRHHASARRCTSRISRISHS